jgi:hypothetical protein
LGRRRSVAETIARRFPSARERPGAGYLPILAPGRLRASPQPRVHTDMTLWRRAPREVYRVYGEDEYLDDEGSTGEGSQANPIPGRWEGQPGVISPASHGSHTAQLLGLGLLVGVVIGVLALVVVNASHKPRTMRPGASRGATADSASHLSGASGPSAISRTSTSRIGYATSNHERASGPHLVHASGAHRVHPPAQAPARWAAGLALVTMPLKLAQTPASAPERDASASSVVGEFDFER